MLARFGTEQEVDMMNVVHGPRRTRLGVRLTDTEMAAIERLARKEFLVPSALVRQIVLRECEQAGISPRDRSTPPGENRDTETAPDHKRGRS
jgi:hypothetical protein